MFGQRDEGGVQSSRRGYGLAMFSSMVQKLSGAHELLAALRATVQCLR